MSTKILGVVGFIAVAVFAAAFLFRTPGPAPVVVDTSDSGASSTISVATSTSSSSPTKTPTPAPVPMPMPTPTPAPAPQGYTLAQVAVHNNASSCWSAINGKVYDLTSWINQHPGGRQAILSLCGRDGSAAYNDQHGGQRRPANELAGFYLAALI